MSKFFKLWLSWLLLAFVLPAYGQSASAKVRVLEVQGAVSPASADFIITGIEEAEEAGAHLLVIELDTPGGLDSSMRAIIQRMLAAELPVVVYVSPGGARAASAGTFILYASHIAAMTPASNLGAASPVAVGGGMPGRKPLREPNSEKGRENEAPNAQDTMEAKALNDAAAYIRSLAELRSRDPDFAEAAVREARSISASEALKAGVVEVIAPTLNNLLSQLDGREVTLNHGQTITLDTQTAEIERVAPDWRYSLLAFLANPQMAVILLMLGIYGLFFEMMSPGAALPGVAGIICLLLGLYGLNMLPVNWAGVGLLCLGLLLMIGEVFLPSFGALGVGGLLAFVLGGLFMTGPDVPSYYELSIPFLVSVGLASAVIIIGAGTIAIRSRRAKSVSGVQTLVGEKGRVVGLDGNLIYAEIRGENWRVISNSSLKIGDEVVVTDVQELKLRVKPTDKANGTPPPLVSA